ncbi:MAG: response regulator, partial [Planctomycetia bacterium]|nr:response regulator [Planctomycetia bacterium]
MRVLIVEPRAAEAAQLCRLLDAYPAAKYLAEVVDHVDRAVAQWREHGADVAMVRLRPGEGLGAQGVVNLCSHAPDLPVIVVADPADEALAVQAVRQGAHDYLSTAQLDTDKLVRSIRYAIEQHQLLTALARSTGKLQASEANLQHIIESNADGV